MFAWLGYLPTIVLVARYRARRAWFWASLQMLGLAACTLTPWALVAVFGVFLAMVVDAIRIGIRRPSPRPPQPLRWLHLPALLVAGIAAALAVRVYLNEAFAIPSTAMVPTLLAGDRLMAEKVTLRTRDPEAGDLLVFRNPCTPTRDFVMRVVAIAGDTVEVRCGRLFRNGTEVPAEPVPGACSYDNFDEAQGTWERVSCLRRRETLGTTRFDTVAEPHETFGAEAIHDFPDVAATDGDLFQCPQGGRPADGGRVVVTRTATEPACAPRAHYLVPPGHVFTMGDNRPNSFDSRAWGPVPVDHIRARVRSIWFSAGPTGVRWSRFGSIE